MVQAKERPRIVVLDDYERSLRKLADWTEIERLADVEVHNAPLRGSSLHAALTEADVIVLVRDRTPLRCDLIERLPKLRYVIFTGARNAALDTAALAARRIPVSHTEWGPSKESTCELTWALILAACKRLESKFGAMRSGGWRDDQPLPGVLARERLGLIGLGEIGGRVARVGQAFGMQVVTWSPRMTPERAAEKGATALSLEELLSTSKVVSLHLVATDQTRGLLNAERLARVRTDAIVVNTSRSALIDTPALLAALQAGTPGMAALDVYDEEPLARDHPLRLLPNVVLTPHIGFVSQPVFEAFARGVTECLRAWLHGEPIVRPMQT
ncbi:MAG TPA: D-2-hydroxyacid dehydrogenase family protein [Burkholderiaceae bacterium]|nr:D-2-hydroxyacid dehydrogenase family protein [Burkholderiaceae bacterium]